VRDPESIARAVSRLIDSPALVAEVVTNAKALVAQKYDWAAIAQAQKRHLFERS
jgi:glycosyltransferase involved in cell wall biosynthesis